MPVNYLHSLVHRVEAGWDPISPDYARGYAELAWNERRVELVDQLESELQGLEGKRVLDLGGGPGQYSVLFAQRGAEVTWHDVSREYEQIARNRALAAGVELRFSLGYLEDSERFGSEPFDLVFCRVCWYYARNDRTFSRILYSVVKPGGVGYIECNTPAFARPRGFRRLQYALNEFLWWKIGHPYPPHGRIAELIRQQQVAKIAVDYSSKVTDAVMFVRPKALNEAGR